MVGSICNVGEFRWGIRMKESYNWVEARVTYHTLFWRYTFPNVKDIRDE